MDVRRLSSALVLVVVLGGILLPSAGAKADNRVASESLRTFLSLAKRGVSGSFSEVYEVSGAPFGGTVQLAQIALAGHQASLTGTDTWSFVYQKQEGYSSQWVEKGDTAWDCWHPPSASSWTCTGPGQFRYVNGYLMAVSPFVPLGVLGAINALKGALTSKTPGIKKIVARRTLFESTSQRFGPLQCLRVAGGTTCLDRSGVVVTSTQVFGGAIKLVRFSRSVSKTAFVLLGSLPPSGVPFVALPQPYVD